MKAGAVLTRQVTVVRRRRFIALAAICFCFLVPPQAQASRRGGLIEAVYWSDAVVVGALEDFTAGTFADPERRVGKLNVTQVIRGDNLRTGPLVLAFPDGWGRTGFWAALRKTCPFLLVTALSVAVACCRRLPQWCRRTGIRVGVCAGCLAAVVAQFHFASAVHSTDTPRLGGMLGREAIWTLMEANEEQGLRRGWPRYLPLSDAHREVIAAFVDEPDGRRRKQLRESLAPGSDEAEIVAALAAIVSLGAESVPPWGQ